MDNNTNMGTTFTGEIPGMPQPQAQQPQKGNGGVKADSKLIAIAAVVVVLLLVILIPKIAGAITDGKVKKAVKTYTQVFMSGDTKARDVNWSKYYPKDIEDEAEDWAKAYYERRKDYGYFEDVEHLKFLSITKLSGKDMADILEDAAKSYFLSNFDVEKSDLRDISASKGYIVTTQMEYDGDLRVDIWLVIKVDGRYGVYGTNTLLSE